MTTTVKALLLLAVVASFSNACQEDVDCKRPRCSCFTTKPPKGLEKDDVPQFVMFSFDDGVNIVNYGDTYGPLFTGSRVNKANKCPIAATFFVTHEYTNYSLLHELYRHGNEIAVHSITHESDISRWKGGSYGLWQNEMVGMRNIISKFANIPSAKVSGHRAPFLQTAGDTTFDMLHKEGFLYDSSMPTLDFADPPAWPYTLDYGYEQGCQIQPCPEGQFRGLWEVPLINYFSIKTDFTCSMADACTPYPETVDDTFEFFRVNFERHHRASRAPFPVFLHEAWIKNSRRKEGYIRFLDWLLQKDDVYVVTAQTVIEYLKFPVNKGDYKQPNCVRSVPESNCKVSRNCRYDNLEQFWGGSRYMNICGDTCPRKYPWLNNPEGQ